MRRLNRLLVATALLCAMAWSFGAAAQTPDDIIKRGKVVIAVDTVTPPYGSIGSDGQPDGYDPAMARLVAKYLGVSVELVPVTSQNRIPFLLTGRVDMVISLFSITPERALQIGFSIPYANEASVLVAPKAMALSNLAELKGRKVGVPRGTLQDAILSAKPPEGATIQRYDDEATAIQAMLAGQIDVLGTGSQVPREMNRIAPGKDYEVKVVLREAHFGIGVRRSQTELRDWLNTVIYTVKNNGELNAISEKYRASKLPTLPVF